MHPALAKGMQRGRGMAGKSYTKTSRCWPGYEPVPGKSEHEEHSCRKKPEKRNGGEAVKRETARKKQVAKGGERGGQAKAAGPLSTAQRTAAKKAGTKRAVVKKSPAKKAVTKKAAAKKSSVKKSSAKKAVAKTASEKKAAAKKAR
jgi:hypothetical protein